MGSQWQNISTLMNNDFAWTWGRFNFIAMVYNVIKLEFLCSVGIKTINQKYFFLCVKCLLVLSELFDSVGTPLWGSECGWVHQWWLLYEQSQHTHSQSLSGCKDVTTECWWQSKVRVSDIFINTSVWQDVCIIFPVIPMFIFSSQIFSGQHLATFDIQF